MTSRHSIGCRESGKLIGALSILLLANGCVANHALFVNPEVNMERHEKDLQDCVATSQGKPAPNYPTAGRPNMPRIVYPGSSLSGGPAVGPPLAVVFTMGAIAGLSKGVASARANNNEVRRCMLYRGYGKINISDAEFDKIKKTNNPNERLLYFKKLHSEKSKY